MKRILLTLLLAASLGLAGCSKIETNKSYINSQVADKSDLSVQETYYAIVDEYTEQMELTAHWLMIISKIEYECFKNDDALLLTKQENTTDKLIMIAREGTENLTEVPFDTQKEYDTFEECKNKLSESYIRTVKPILITYVGR